MTEKSSGLKNEVEAAQYLCVSKQSLIRLRRAGMVGYYRIGRRILYGQEHLDNYLEYANQQVFSVNCPTTEGGQK